jgi:hypothetical protein
VTGMANAGDERLRKFRAIKPSSKSVDAIAFVRRKKPHR